ncbi:hypothetical protein [Tamlana flava]|uniref:hypothetical protein n=1 Tax=Tamlana flava TaxID=3158572 RepID=UPI00351AF263
MSFNIMAFLFIMFVGHCSYGQIPDIKSNSKKAIDLAVENQLNSIKVSSNTFSFFNTTDTYYNMEFFNKASKYFSGTLNLEFEDEPSYDTGVKLLRNFMYLNLNLNYNIGKIRFAISISNILNFFDSEFSIIPELYGNNEVIEDFYFVINQSFSIQTAITYNF